MKRPARKGRLGVDAHTIKNKPVRRTGMRDVVRIASDSLGPPIWAGLVFFIWACGPPGPYGPGSLMARTSGPRVLRNPP
jgi:hypothetical protein